MISFLLLFLQGISTGNCFVNVPRARFDSRWFRLRVEIDQEPDLFDYFDPLLSPHAYPNGISPSQKPLKTANPQMSSFIKSETDPGRTPALGRDLNEPLVDYFDPTLSPHKYSRGTPSAVIGDNLSRKPTLGILLIDHGSRNQVANRRLEEMASLYQQSVDSVVVAAAHMELASPSIQQGLEDLLKRGVDEIVCHPYFLSPDGRHVREDIPRLVDEAIQTLKVKIPVRTTDAVGSEMHVMLGVIHSLVQKESSLLRVRSQNVP